MSSEIVPRHLKADDLNIIGRVLDHGGYYGPKNEVAANDRHRASRFLLKLFQNGVYAEIDLSAALKARDTGVPDGGRIPREVWLEAVNRWADDGGRPE